MPAASLSPTFVTIPNGGTVDVTVAWTLDPGSPDQSGHLTLALDGEVLFDSPIVKQGTPAEPEPQIVLSNPTAGQALISSDVAQVARLSATTFRLS